MKYKNSDTLFKDKTPKTNNNIFKITVFLFTLKLFIFSIEFLKVKINTNILKILIIMIGLLIVLSFKNSMEFKNIFYRKSYILAILSIISTYYCLSNMSKYTEFLYFNF